MPRGRQSVQVPEEDDEPSRCSTPESLLAAVVNSRRVAGSPWGCRSGLQLLVVSASWFDAVSPHIPDGLSSATAASGRHVLDSCSAALIAAETTFPHSRAVEDEVDAVLVCKSARDNLWKVSQIHISPQATFVPFASSIATIYMLYRVDFWRSDLFPTSSTHPFSKPSIHVLQKPHTLW